MKWNFVDVKFFIFTLLFLFSSAFAMDHSHHHPISEVSYVFKLTVKNKSADPVHIKSLMIESRSGGMDSFCCSNRIDPKECWNNENKIFHGVIASEKSVAFICPVGKISVLTPAGQRTRIITTSNKKYSCVTHGIRPYLTVNFDPKECRVGGM